MRNRIVSWIIVTGGAVVLLSGSALYYRARADESMRPLPAFLHAVMEAGTSFYPGQQTLPTYEPGATTEPQPVPTEKTVRSGGTITPLPSTEPSPSPSSSSTPAFDPACASRGANGNCLRAEAGLLYAYVNSAHAEAVKVLIQGYGLEILESGTTRYLSADRYHLVRVPEGTEEAWKATLKNDSRIVDVRNAVAGGF